MTADSRSAARARAEPATRRFWYPYLLIAPTMVTLVVVSLIPFLYAIYLSLHEVKYGRVRGFAWFENYAAVLTDERFWNSMWVAVVFVFVAVPVEFMLGLAGALVLNAGIKGRGIAVPLLFVPTMMAPIVVGLLWKIMLAGSWGLISYNFLERFGILNETSVFASPGLALYALIFVDVWQWTPFMMLAFFAGLQALPANPYHAAAIDGASPVQAFFKLTLPMLAPLLVVIGLLRFIDAFKVFDSIFILTGGGPGDATESPSILAYLTFNLSFYVWVMRSFCRDLPIELEEAAMVDGYPRWQVLLKIVYPLLRPGIVAAAVLSFIFAWNEFLFAFMLGGDRIKTLPVAIPTLITTQGVRWGEMSVIGIVALLPVLAVVFLLQRHIVRGLTLGAVKG